MNRMNSVSESYIKSNLHTHSTFCDGKNTPEENVIAAIQKNIRVLGFTSHSMFPFWTETYMHPEDFSSYCAEIHRLQKKYAGQITIRLGFETDFIPGVSVPNIQNYAEFEPDYLIGSVHFIFQREGAFAVDYKTEILKNGAEKYYKNDIRSLICDYFSLQKEMLLKGDFAVLGHADLIRKFNEKSQFFDETEDWYKNELKELASAVARAGIATEINSGAIARGYLSKPYPSEYFLSLLKEKGVPVAITADAHAEEMLDCDFENSLLLAKKIGYTEVIYDIDRAGYRFCSI